MSNRVVCREASHAGSWYTASARCGGSRGVRPADPLPCQAGKLLLLLGDFRRRWRMRGSGASYLETLLLRLSWEARVGTVGRCSAPALGETGSDTRSRKRPSTRGEN
ncbi:hypothetical protein JZ751_024236 [Albula glossodonta]|uniref:Uncharacterized protein n=1 Tax=Albula glossodonta TaxID=121402 RepID=A0A8T2NJA6_9TELE|nr:hypothetical protein JZ751_024236 [Albula glossodonta]